MELLAYEIGGGSLGAWLLLTAVAAAVFVVLHVAVRIIVSRLGSLSSHTETMWDDLAAAALQKTCLPLQLVLAVYVAGAFFMPDGAGDHISTVIKAAVVLALIFQGGLWAHAGLAFWLDSFRRKKADKDPGAVTTLGAVGFIAKVTVWAVVLLLVLDNLGVRISAIIAGLGVGGIAVALAVQNILGDLFASLSIVLDKPFVVGDFLIVDDYLGKVERVGLKTTRIRSLSGEQLIFSNNDLLKSRLRNYGRLYERRVVFSLGVVYQTTREQLEQIPSIIRQAVEAQENTRFDRSHFKDYGEFSLNFETVYFVLTPDYNTYMDIQQAINLTVYSEFEDRGIEFAYPTRTLFVTPAANGEKASAEAEAEARITRG